MKKIRIGTFNVNNLFERPRVMELEGFSDTGKEAGRAAVQGGEDREAQEDVDGDEDGEEPRRAKAHE